MFDIGFAELALLMLIGLIVLGPERLPRVARTIGLYVRKARNAWGNVKQSVEAELDADEIRKALSQVKGEVKATGDSLRSTLNTEISIAEEKPTEQSPEPSPQLQSPVTDQATTDND